MSKILVVEPQRMLQVAIAFALFPDHEVQITPSLPEASELRDFDAVIVDAVSLGESGKAAVQGIRTVQGWKVPTILVERAPTVHIPRRGKLISIKSPIGKESLQLALAECLGNRSKTKRNGDAAGLGLAARDSKLIELVDVVEEGPELKTEQPRQKKKK